MGKVWNCQGSPKNAFVRIFGSLAKKSKNCKNIYGGSGFSLREILLVWISLNIKFKWMTSIVHYWEQWRWLKNIQMLKKWVVLSLTSWCVSLLENINDWIRWKNLVVGHILSLRTLNFLFKKNWRFRLKKDMGNLLCILYHCAASSRRSFSLPFNNLARFSGILKCGHPMPITVLVKTPIQKICKDSWLQTW